MDVRVLPPPPPPPSKPTGAPPPPPLLLELDVVASAQVVEVTVTVIVVVAASEGAVMVNAEAVPSHWFETRNDESEYVIFFPPDVLMVIEEPGPSTTSNVLEPTVISGIVALVTLTVDTQYNI
jgi:hypothetical protein